LLQLAEMMECESKPSDISHMDLLYAQIDDITLSEVCQAMENEFFTDRGKSLMNMQDTKH
jgi:hypothetical protein